MLSFTPSRCATGTCDGWGLVAVTARYFHEECGTKMSFCGGADALFLYLCRVCLGAPKGVLGLPVGGCRLPAAHCPCRLLSQVKEWLCLNCQMQRALGMDMTTAPRSKSQQQLHSPSPSPSHSPAKHPPALVVDKSPPAAHALPPEPPKPHSTTPQREPHGQGQPKPQEAARSSLQHQQAKPSSSEQRKMMGDVGAKPAAPVPGAGAQEQPQEGLTGKLFGFGASLLTQASTLMSVQPEAPPPSQPSPGKVPPKIVFSDASKEAGPKAPGAQGGAGAAPAAKPGKPEQGIKPKEVPKARVSCPLCKAEINVGSGEPPNYNTCTTCRQQVCNMCGFNPTPHLVEVRGLLGVGAF